MEAKPSNLCDICFDNKKNCLFMPCNHVSTCYDCGKQIFDKNQPKCVICR
jgi:hypothetical protein